MPAMDFTAAAINALAPSDRLIEFQDTRQPGLCLRVTPAGVKSWTLRYRTRVGARKRIALGTFPALPVSVARSEAAKILGDVARGGDPAQDRKDDRATESRQALETVAAVGKLYLSRCEDGKHRHNGKPFKPASLALEKSYFENVIQPALGKERLADLTRARIQVLIDDTERDKSKGAARHSRAILQRIFGFAVWQDIVTNDPTRFVSAPGWTDRERVLTDEELRALWNGIETVKALPDTDLSPAMGFAIKLAAVTLQRRGEVSGIHLGEIDEAGRLWHLPGSRTKNGRSHVVPLSELALGLIRSAKACRVGRGRESELLFPSPRDPGKPIRPHALTHAWTRLIPTLTMPAPTPKAPDRRKPVEGITPHDLRRTGATNMTGERIGIPRFIVSKVLNHSSDAGGAAGVTSIYDRNAYLPEKRRALDAWAALLVEIVEEKERASNVVALAR